MRRLFALALDWLVIAAWGAVVFGAVWAFTSGQLPADIDPWKGQVVGFLAMTLPVTSYFALLERSKARASLGKRLVGLQVVDTAGGSLPLGRSLLRNAIKFMPWECGHLVAHQAISSGDAGPSTWVYVPMAVAFGVPLWWFVALLVTGQTPYDRWARARVISANGP